MTCCGRAGEGQRGPSRGGGGRSGSRQRKHAGVPSYGCFGSVMLSYTSIIGVLWCRLCAVCCVDDLTCVLPGAPLVPLVPHTHRLQAPTPFLQPSLLLLPSRAAVPNASTVLQCLDAMLHLWPVKFLCPPPPPRPPGGEPFLSPSCSRTLGPKHL